jgi:hypothetical protein
MARMKRIVNRYGKITLASLGGFLVTIGTFLVVLSSLTVTDVARADECRCYSEMQEGMDCSPGDSSDPECYFYCCPLAAGCAGNTSCDASGNCWLTGVYGSCSSYTIDCNPSGRPDCSLCGCMDRSTGIGCDCKQ